MRESQDTQADPPRLSEEGGVFVALAELRGHGLSAERLDSAGEALAQHIASSTGAAGSASASTSTGLAAKLGLGLLTVAVAAGAWWALGRGGEAQPRETAAVAIVAMAVDAGIISTSDAAMPEAIVDASTIVQQIPQEPLRWQAPKVNGTIRADAAPPASQLPEQLQLLKEAKALANAGQHSLALERLAYLSDRFPNTPLQAEVDLRRAISLSGKGDLEKARAALRELLKDPRHSGRKAELHHMLVDIYVQRGECASAQAALKDATAAGLDATSLVSAERGVLRCRPLTAPSERK